MRIKTVTYERLQSDPRGFNNTKIGMSAEIDKNENPIPVLNELKMLVDGRHKAYNEVREAKHKIGVLENSLEFLNDKLLQLKPNEETILKSDKYKVDILKCETDIQKLKKTIYDLTGC
jgi:hypothetical protein